MESAVPPLVRGAQAANANRGASCARLVWPGFAVYTRKRNLNGTRSQTMLLPWQLEEDAEGREQPSRHSLQNGNEARQRSYSYFQGESELRRRQWECRQGRARGGVNPGKRFCPTGDDPCFGAYKLCHCTRGLCGRSHSTRLKTWGRIQRSSCETLSPLWFVSQEKREREHEQPTPYPAG
jgi:hypothetical protein